MLATSTRLAALLALLALGLATVARAGGADAAGDSTASAPGLFDTDRPDVSNGSGRVDPGVVQVETGWSRTAEGSRVSQSFGDALVRIGVSRAFELRVFTPGVTRVSFRGSSDAEWDQAGAGFKLGGTSADGNRGIGVLAGLSVPFTHPGSLTDGEVVLAGDWSSDLLGVNANLGLHRVASHGDASTSVLASVSLSHGWTQRVAMFVEIAGERPTEAGSDWARFADTGASWAVARHLQLDASAGRDLGPGSPWTIGAGFSKRW